MNKSFPPQDSEDSSRSTSQSLHLKGACKLSKPGRGRRRMLGPVPKRAANARRVTAGAVATALLATLLALVPASPAAAAVPLPASTITVPEFSFIGSTIDVGVTFKNASVDTVGYGPYTDIYLDSTGADGDDGATFAEAKYLGQTVQRTTQTLLCNGTDVHPLTQLPISCPTGFTAGDTLTVLTLPFGSFTPAQSALNLDVKVSISDKADVDVPLNIATIAGFRFGDSATGSTPIIQSLPSTTSVSPVLAILEKTNSAPEDETATGENFPRQWTVTGTFAPGQTLTNVTLSDQLPPTVRFVGFTSISGGGSASATPSTAGPQSTPNNVAAADWSTATNSVEMQFGFVVPEFDATGNAILSPSSGTAVEVPNNASLTGTWTPLDPRDTPVRINLDPTGPEDVITAKSLATQKNVNIVHDVGAPGATPGDTLEWMIDIQVSDYFKFGALAVVDRLSDGQHIDTSFTPHLAVSAPGVSLPDVPGFGDNFFTPGMPADCGAAYPGSIEIAADISAAVAAALPPTAGELIGGDGSSATTARITFRTIIDANHTCFAGRSVNSQDVISNDVTVAGAVINRTTGIPTGRIVTDGSSDQVRIVAPALAKSVYAINGDTSVTGSRITPGDVVTYRIRATLPITNTLNTTLTDFLPLPTFDIPDTGMTADFVTPTPPGSFTPTPWSVTRGSADTFTGAAQVTGSDPTLSVDQANNSFTLAYPDYQVAAGTTPETIDLLVNVVAADTRFADGLFLTNQVGITYSDSEYETFSQASIVQVELTEPRLAMTKGVVATNRAAGASFTPATTGPGTWTAPGMAGKRFSGNITSVGLAAIPVNSNLSGVDAGDTVTFAIVVENLGSSANGAFDVTIADVLPVGFVQPIGGWNLSVTDGLGSPLAYTPVTGAGTGPLGDGLVLDDNTGSPRGSLTQASDTSGTNIAVVTFDASLAATVETASKMTNSASVTKYAGTSGGPNFLTTPLGDTADINTLLPTSSKTITGTQMVPGTPDSPTRSGLTIGSLVSYNVQMTVPEGVTPNAVLRDTLDAGLAVVSIDSVTANASLSSSNPAAFTVTNGVVSSVGTGTSAPGRRVSFDLGTITNSDTDNSTVETIDVALTAVVLNVAANSRSTAQTRRNASNVLVKGTVVGSTANSLAITVVEPAITSSKTPSVAHADAGDVVEYTIVVTAPSALARTSNAYEVNSIDDIPSGVTYTAGTLTHTAGVAPGSLTILGSKITATWPLLTPGQSSTFKFSATVDSDAAASGPSVTNTVKNTWSSQPGTPSSQSTYNPLGVERTGDTTDPGLLANTYGSSGSGTVTVNSTSIAKSRTSANATVRIGEVVDYKIGVNLPEGDLGDVVIIDAIPAGMTYVAGSATVDSTSFGGTFTGPTVNVVGNNVTVTLGAVSLPSTPGTADNTLSVTMSAKVADVVGNQSGTVLTNSARVTVGGTQFTSNNVPVTVAVPELTVTKTASSVSAAANDVVTYTIEVENTGDAHAYDMTVTDHIPDSQFDLTSTPHTEPTGWSYSSVPDASGAGIAWTAAAGLAPGATAKFTLTLTLIDPLTYPGTYTNTATSAGSTMPGVVTGERNVSGSESATITHTAVDIAVEKTADVGAAEPGDTVTYTIKVSNDGTRAANGVDVVDTLGDHITFESASGGGTLGAGKVTWPEFDLAAGASRSLTVTVTIVDPLPVGATATVNSVTAADNAAHGPDSDPTNNTDSASVTLGSAAVIDVEKVARVTSTTTGSTIIWDITVANNGNINAEGVTLSDTLGDHLTFVSASDSGTFDTGVISWPAFDLAGDGGSHSFTVSAEVASTVSAGTRNVSNSATGTHTDGTVTSTDSDSSVTPLIANPDLAITKTDGSDTMLAGADVRYDIQVTNIGDSGAGGVVVTDELPDEVTFNAASGTATYDPVARAVTWNLGVVNVGDLVDLWVDVTADDPFAPGTTSVTNTASVTDDGTNGPDLDLSNNTAVDTDITGADLSVTKKLTSGSALTPGAQATYRIVVSNDGPETISELVLSEVYDIGLSNMAAKASGGSFDATTGLWSGLALAPGDKVTLTVTFDVELTATGDLTNDVTVEPVGVADPTPGNNTDSVTDKVVPVVELRLTKELQGELVRGSDASYRLTVTNAGPSNATGVVVTDTLPAELSFKSFEGAGWVCKPGSGQDVECRFGGAIAPGESEAFTLATTVSDTAAGSIVNSASVAGNENNSGGGASVASAAASLPPLPPLAPGPDAEPRSPSPSNQAQPTIDKHPHTGVPALTMLLLAGALLAAGATVLDGRRRYGTR